MARQVIALLFTDIVDSTALFGSLGLDRAQGSTGP
jgi:class 3 adenylate cyclase